VVEWNVEIISRPFFAPKWDVSASEPDEKPAKWKAFFRRAVNLTMPLAEYLNTIESLRAHPEMQAFLGFIEDKPSGFDVKVRRNKDKKQKEKRAHLDAYDLL
jgi:hypothetical protein